MSLAKSCMMITEVVHAAGLDRAEIYRAAELEQLGAPGHFRYVGSILTYTPEGCARLVEGLDKLGHGTAAAALRAEVRRRVDPARDFGRGSAAKALGNWMRSWESREDGAA